MCGWRFQQAKTIKATEPIPTMPSSWNEIRARATTFAADWRGTESEDAEAQPFWEAFFEVFGVSRRKVSSFEKRVNKLGTAQGKIDLLWKGTLLMEHKSRGQKPGQRLQAGDRLFSRPQA